jgi:hypothetical protein
MPCGFERLEEQLPQLEGLDALDRLEADGLNDRLMNGLFAWVIAVPHTHYCQSPRSVARLPQATRLAEMPDAGMCLQLGVH